MCIINEPARVTKTQIFVAPNANKDKQLTVYCNKVMTDSTNNVMILPVPNPDSVKFHDLSDYKDIFDDLAKTFAVSTRGLKSYTLSFSNSTEQYLPTIDVGSYRITLVPNVASLNAINPHEFGTVRAHIKRIMRKYYASGFGFVVCKLIPGKETEYHPLAYSHNLRSDGNLFVPTRHQHNGHNGHDNGPGGYDGDFSRVNFLETRTMPPRPYPIASFVAKESEEELESDWDHEIYSFNTTSDSGNVPASTRRVYLKPNKIPDFDLGSCKTCHKFEIHGIHENCDVMFALV